MNESNTNVVVDGSTQFPILSKKNTILVDLSKVVEEVLIHAISPELWLENKHWNI